jgi:hypothetical protein
MKYLLILITTLLAGSALAQHEEQNDTVSKNGADTISLYQAFRKGKTTGHFRYFFMATDNESGLKDYYANAVGGGLKYETAPFHRLQFGVGGFFIYNIKSSNLAEKDPVTNQHNRYELSLFDLEDPENKNDIDRLEELYIKYSGDNLRATLGKQLIHTPFINPQDSRMRPTEVEGLYGEMQAGKKWKMEGGWIYGISPRSTVEWYAVAKSIGVNSQGVNPDGTLGNYRDHLSSKGIGLLGVTFQPMEYLKIKGYNQYAENLFNTALIQAEYNKDLDYGEMKIGLQYIRQDALNHGGNVDPAKTYFNRGNKVNILGARVALQRAHWETSLNYTRITKSGRFTMPREWGTEPLFTYLSRERSEGYGDVDAITANIKGAIPNTGFRFEVGYGHYYLPQPDNALLNKYGMPSYNHLKTLADYEFKGSLRGLDLAFLYIYKGQLPSEDYPAKYIFNKVNMSSFNLIMNYHF